MDTAKDDGEHESALLVILLLERSNSDVPLEPFIPPAQFVIKSLPFISAASIEAGLAYLVRQKYVDVVESGAFRINEKYENVQRLASVLIDASSAFDRFQKNGKVDLEEIIKSLYIQFADQRMLQHTQIFVDLSVNYYRHGIVALPHLSVFKDVYSSFFSGVPAEIVWNDGTEVLQSINLLFIKDDRFRMVSVSSLLEFRQLVVSRLFLNYFEFYNQVINAIDSVRHASGEKGSFLDPERALLPESHDGYGPLAGRSAPLMIGREEASGTQTLGMGGEGGSGGAGGRGLPHFDALPSPPRVAMSGGGSFGSQSMPVPGTGTPQQLSPGYSDLPSGMPIPMPMPMPMPMSMHMMEREQQSGWDLPPLSSPPYDQWPPSCPPQRAQGMDVASWPTASRSFKRERDPMEGSSLLSPGTWGSPLSRRQKMGREEERLSMPTLVDPGKLDMLNEASRSAASALVLMDLKQSMPSTYSTPPMKPTEKKNEWGAVEDLSVLKTMSERRLLSSRQYTQLFKRWARRVEGGDFVVLTVVEMFRGGLSQKEISKFLQHYPQN
eukprot:TRINITY_DN3243_c0_g1_i1.p1 TRINITY_DN3243_c0_g1~~TRINITY_DN3243_c0_g1_i1.p1  ORF type:complete len:605 (-),score=143.75 TRINITY_DN3243_c0_g1_i1:71-1726(-)